MSQNTSSTAKKWMVAIQANEFTKVQKEMEVYHFEDKVSKTKALQRLLIYLCQTATKCPLTDRQTGHEISDLTETICNNLTQIPATSDYFASLYHIIRILLEMQLFEEAMTITNYLLPPSTWHKQTLSEGKLLSENYVKLTSIFYISIEKFLRSKKPGSFTASVFHKIQAVIQYQLTIENLTKSDGSKSLLVKLLHYTEFLKHLQCSQEAFDEFTEKFFLKSLSSISLHLGDRNRLPTYDNFTKIVSTLCLHYIKTKRLEDLRKTLKKFLKNFDNCMLEFRESSKCHQLLKDFCKIFIKPPCNFSTNACKEINKLLQKIQEHIVSYSEESFIKSNIYAASSILEALFILWGESPESSLSQLTPEVITSTTSLLSYLSEIIKNYQVDSLCKCGSKNCLILQDKLKSCSLKSKIVVLLYRLCPKSELPPEFYEQFSMAASQAVDLLYDLQEKNCERWRPVWCSIAASTYNFGLNFSSSHYEKSLELSKFLASSIIRLNVTGEDNSFFQSNPTPPLAMALHRISNMCYGNNQYHEARIFTAINVYLHPSHPECKGYRNWSFIHYKDPSFRGLTLVELLWKHSEDLRVLDLGSIRLSNEVLKDICLREIKSHIGIKLDLSESILAVLNTLESLNADAISYATAVHQLGHHSLYFQSNISFSDHLKKALYRLKSFKSDKSNREQVQYLIAHLNLYDAIEEIKSLEEATKTEMESTNIKLYAVSTSGLSAKGSNVVPSFSQVNITTAMTLASRLEDMYNLWKQTFTPELVIKWNAFDGTSTVTAVIVAGEYCRFYRLKNLEIKFWKIGYDLAVKTANFKAIVYITGRSIMSRYIKDDWMKKSEEIIADNLMNPKESKVPAVTAMFKMSLSDYYYSIGRIEEADKLFDEGMKAAPLSISENCGTFIFSQHLVLTHRFHNFEPQKRNNLQYIGIIANILYAMLLIDDTAADLKDLRWSLYEMDMLLEVSCNIAIRMNALFSFREVTAHLVRRLNVCQPKMSVLRVAEMLKYLCFIDLSRNQLEDCEVKLQGMELILQMETLERFQEREVLKLPDSCSFPTTVSPERGVDPIRDTPQNGSSPFLRRERFALPEFVRHEQKCRCFKCVNEAYKFLVFSCTHIRAQLYSLQNLTHYARQHFEGALNISQTLLDLSRKNDNYQFNYVIDYVVFLLDYVRFLKRNPSTYDEGKKIVCWALEICDIYKLECHPVYQSSMDIVVEYSFDKVFSGGMPRSSLVIPEVDDIDIGEYVDHEGSIPDGLCVTPAKESGSSPRPRSRSPRRNQAPLLNLSTANIDVVESEPEELSPSLMALDKRKKRTISRIKPVRRKLAEDDDFDQDEESIPGKLLSGDRKFNREKSSRKESTDSSLATIIFGVEGLSVNSSGSRVQTVAEGIERLSVRSTRSGGSNVPDIKVDNEEPVGNDEVEVDSSHVEPRRSRRLVEKNSTTKTKLSRKRL